MKSKKAFLMFAVVIAVLVILVIIGYQPNTDLPQETAPVCSTDAEGNVYVPVGNDTVETTEPTMLEVATTPVPFVPETTAPITSVQVSENVTIHQVECDPNEEINRSMYAYPGDPEYLQEEEYAGPYISDNGHAYRNDKTISITVSDPVHQLNPSYTIQFGYITGKCNRFLYMNPIVISDPTIPYYFKFSVVRIDGQSGGDIYVPDVPKNPDTKSRYFFAALDDGGDAQYRAPNNPGVFWIGNEDLPGPFYVDCDVYGPDGYQVALLRLTILKAEDDTYSLANITNRDLLADPDQDILPEGDIEVLIEFGAKVIENKDHQYFESTSNLNYIRDREHYRMEVLDETTGLYFPFYRSYPSGEGEHEKKHIGNMLPIVAVSFRTTVGFPKIMYFLETSPAREGRDGTYILIGQVFAPFLKIEHLRDMGYGA